MSFVLFYVVSLGLFNSHTKRESWAKKSAVCLKLWNKCHQSILPQLSMTWLRVENDGCTFNLAKLCQSLINRCSFYFFILAVISFSTCRNRLGLFLACFQTLCPLSLMFSQVVWMDCDTLWIDCTTYVCAPALFKHDRLCSSFKLIIRIYKSHSKRTFSCLLKICMLSLKSRSFLDFF